MQKGSRYGNIIKHLCAYFGFAGNPRRKERNMKAKIHPKTFETKVVCTSCGNEFMTHSTRKEIRVDTCSNCHPFYTGRQRFQAAAGRIEKFNKKYGLKSN